MNLVKWFRKNNTKVMAVVVIVLMVGFIGGSSLTYLLRGRGGENEIRAYYNDNVGIKQYDLMKTQKELDILKTLQADTILKALQDPINQTPNLHALLLGELLFSDQRPSQQVISYIQQTAGKFQFRINKKQINDFYKHSAQSMYYWYLLDKEAQNAGFKVQNNASKNMLSSALPKLTGQYYAQYVTNMIKTNGISENEILNAFSKLFAVLQFSHSICSGEDLTINQLKNLSSTQRESIDIEFVRIDADKFLENQEEPTEQQISEQYNKYKEFFTNEITTENPYGFGYKLPDRVQLEYMAVKLDDVKEIITKPTFEELKDFYNTNKSSAFTEQVKANPADPNMGTIDRVKPYSEVEDQISEYLIKEKITTKAQSIIEDARTLADGSLLDIDEAELDKLSIEERKEMAADYSDISKQLSEKYNIKIYNGLTGELSSEDMQTDELLSKLYIRGYVSELNLARIAFSVKEFDMTMLGSYETTQPKMYLSVAPIEDKSASDKIMAVARVVKAIKSSVPENVDVTFSKQPLVLDPNDEDEKENTFSVKENVIKDLKSVAAMETAQEKANEFIAMATSQDDEVWDNVIEKFNELYEQEYPKDPNASEAKDSNEPAFKLEELYALTRFTNETILTIAHNENSPAVEGIKNMLNKESQFLNLIFSKAPQESSVQDGNEPEFKPVLVEFKPDLSYYVFKDISLRNLWKENYERMKSSMAYSQDLSESQSLVIEHFNPSNILERMDFRFAKESEEASNEKQDEQAADEE